MKHAQLLSIVHNIADSLSSGVSLLAGNYELDVYGEASRSPSGQLTVDFLHGAIIDGPVSKNLESSVRVLRDAMRRLCAEAGGSIQEFRTAEVCYWTHGISRRFTVVVEDRSGRRTATDYGGTPGKRLRDMDRLGRVRRKPSRRGNPEADT